MLLKGGSVRKGEYGNKYQGGGGPKNGGGTVSVGHKKSLAVVPWCMVVCLEDIVALQHLQGSAGDQSRTTDLRRRRYRRRFVPSPRPEIRSSAI